MVLLLKILLLLALLNTSQQIQAQNLCPSSHCGSSKVTVLYPFKLQHEAAPSANCTYFDLTCNGDESKVAVDLPSAGEFDVQRIDYADRYIQLYDPGNCLIRRIFDLSLDSSPFEAEFDNFTLYLCPLYVDVEPIPCLSSPTSKAIAVRRSSIYDHQCQMIRSGKLPVEHDDTFFYLKWRPNDCVHCKENESGSWKSRLIAKVIAIALTLLGVIIMALSCCSVYIMKVIRDKYASTSPPEARPEPATSNGGLDESKILGCIEMVIIGESSEGTKTENRKSCSICLENYSEKETMSVISKCGHCFHATCIRRWLEKNATCPVCRTSLSSDVSSIN